MTLTNSLHWLNQMWNIWVFQASCLSFENLKLINSFHRLNQFEKKLRFLDKLFQLWRFSFFPSCFIDEIGSRVCFHASYFSLKKVEKIYFFMYLSGHKKLYFFRKTTRALKLWTNWIHFLDWNDSPNNQFLSKLIDLWNFKVFHFMF